MNLCRRVCVQRCAPCWEGLLVPDLALISAFYAFVRRLQQCTVIQARFALFLYSFHIQRSCTRFQVLIILPVWAHVTLGHTWRRGRCSKHHIELNTRECKRSKKMILLHGEVVIINMHVQLTPTSKSTKTCDLLVYSQRRIGSWPFHAIVQPHRDDVNDLSFPLQNILWRLHVRGRTCTFDACDIICYMCCRFRKVLHLMSL